MSEQLPVSQLEAQARDYIQKEYPIDNRIVEREVAQSLQDAKTNDPGAVVETMLERVDGWLTYGIFKPIHRKAENAGELHFASYIQSIRETETRLGVSQREMTICDELEFLASAEMTFMMTERKGKTKEKFTYYDILLSRKRAATMLEMRHEIEQARKGTS